MKQERASRGQVFAYQVRHSWTGAPGSGVASGHSVVIVLGRATAVSVGGEVLRYTDGRVQHKGRPPSIWLIPLALGEVAWDAWLATREEFDDLDHVRAFVTGESAKAAAQKVEHSGREGV